MEENKNLKELRNELEQAKRERLQAEHQLQRKKNQLSYRESTSRKERSHRLIICGAIFDELRELDWVPRSVRQKSREIEDTIVELEAKLGRTASDSEIAKAMGMTESEYQSTIMKISGTSVLSLNDVWYSGDDSEHLSIGDSIEAPNSLNPDVIVEREEVRRVIIQAIQELPKNEKMVIVLYYHEDLSFREIGQVLNVSESRISQLHAKANLRLRAKLTSVRKGIF